MVSSPGSANSQGSLGPWKGILSHLVIPIRRRLFQKRFGMEGRETIKMVAVHSVCR
jgi:hypothetical protein